MRLSGLLRFLALIFAVVSTWLFIREYINFNIKTLRLPRWIGSAHKNSSQLVKTKCGLSKSCPDNFFAFKIVSGAANVVGPTMCFEDQMIMSPVKNNVGRGLNIVLVDGTKGAVLTQKSFDMYSGDASLLAKFLKEISRDMLVLVASYDDPGTKMNDEIRKLFSNLGSTHAKQLGFRDSWVFLGAQNLQSKSPFEQTVIMHDISQTGIQNLGDVLTGLLCDRDACLIQFLKNNPETNKYDGWPELLELEGCVPRKV